MGLLLAAATCILFSCKKTTTSVVTNTNTGGTTDSNTAQYGTPFAGVPDVKDIIMYEVNIRAFSASDDFAGIEARMDSIRALGVNVIWLMPAYPVGKLKAANSPYCVQDCFLVNPEFGTLADMQHFVSMAHSKGMAVILDWVSDGTSWDNIWIEQGDKSWYMTNSAGVIQSNPDYGDNALLNYNSKDLRAALIAGMQYWVQKANVDGYRCDNADFEPDDLWAQEIAALDTLHHKLILLAESESTSKFGLGFQMGYSWSYFTTLRNVFGSGASAQTLSTTNTSDNNVTPAGDEMLRFTSNHDEDRDPGPPEQLFGGLNGSIAAFALVATMGGVPLIYNGQEVGCTTPLTIFNTSTLIDWTANNWVSGAYEQIIAFRNANDAVKEGNTTYFSSNNVCAFERSQPGDTALIIVNARSSAQTFTLPSALANTAWLDGRNTNASLSLGASLVLQPYQYMLLRKQ